MGDLHIKSKRPPKHQELSGFGNLTIKSIIDSYKKGQVSPVDIAKICIDEFKRFEKHFQAWEYFDEKKLILQARNSEKYINTNKIIRPLEGIPVGIKDIFNTVDYPTQMGSKIWKGFTPGNDARVVYSIKQAGAVIPGKTVTAEFAVHTLGKTLNPHNIKRTPGTSSSGSAVAIALGMVPVALGTQTAGSIIRPASFCGVYGFKPSFGLIPRTGMLKTTDSLDTVGFFASHADDLKYFFDIIRVRGKDYPISDHALNDQNRQRKPTPRPWRIAFVETHVWKYAREYVKKSISSWTDKISRAKDIEVSHVNLPDIMKYAHETHAQIYDKSLSYYFKEEFKKSTLVSPIMYQLINHGNKISLSTYKNALQTQIKMADAMDKFLKNFDILVSLATASEAPLRTQTEDPDPALMWTMTYLPAINIPAFVSMDGMPFGVQLAARRYNDYLLLDFVNYLKELSIIPLGANPLFV